MIRKIQPKSERRDASADSGIKRVPAAAGVRARVRDRARSRAASLSRARPLKRGELERLGRAVLDELNLSTEYLGFAMVMLSNEFWREQFAAIPFGRRLLLLPHCLRDVEACRGTYSALGLECAGCGACPIAFLKGEAEGLGYRVLVAEGTPAVVQIVLSGRADAVLGVACLDSLERAFERVVELGIPHVATPLLVDGCVETIAELNEVTSLIRLSAGRTAERTRSYVPLLRSAEQLFEPGIFEALLAGERQAARAVAAARAEPMVATEAIGLDWMHAGGKRFRPFVTLASFAAMTLGEGALHPETDLTDAFPEVVQRAALAIEALHKASLVHDDIEDDDAFRYGVETLHRRYGIPVAINVGDYLIGLGYRLIAAGADELGAECAAEMLSVLSRSHLRLARGQGAELLWRRKDPHTMRPLDLLTIYALKTAPAFEAAMLVGLRAAGPVRNNRDVLAAYARYLGVAYQVLNDLKDWKTDAHDKMLAGQDLLSMRPTILQAFAFEATDEPAGRELTEMLRADAPDDEKLTHLRRLYETHGVFERAQTLVEKYRARTRAAAAGIEPPALRELLHFITDVVLR